MDQNVSRINSKSINNFNEKEEEECTPYLVEANLDFPISKYFDLEFPVSIMNYLRSKILFNLDISKIQDNIPIISLSEVEISILLNSPQNIVKSAHFLYIFAQHLILSQNEDLGPKFIEYFNSFPAGIIDFSIYISLLIFSSHIFPKSLIFLLSIAHPSLFTPFSLRDDLKIHPNETFQSVIIHDIIIFIFGTLLSKNIFNSIHIHYLFPILNNFLSQNEYLSPIFLDNIFKSFCCFSEPFSINSLLQILKIIKNSESGNYLKARISLLCIHRCLDININDKILDINSFSFSLEKKTLNLNSNENLLIFQDPSNIFNYFPKMQKIASFPEDEENKYDFLIEIISIIPDFASAWYKIGIIDKEFIQHLSHEVSSITNQSIPKTRLLLKECIQVVTFFLDEILFS